MRPYPARRALATRTSFVPRLERLRGFAKLRNRFGGIDEVAVIALGTAEVLTPELQAKVSGVHPRTVPQA